MHTPGHPPVEDLAATLEALAAGLRVTHADEALVVALGRETPRVTAAPLPERLRFHAAPLGLRVVHTDVTLDELHALPGHLLPVAIPTASGEVIVIAERRGARWLVRAAGDEAWLDFTGLAARLGAAGDGGRYVAVSAELATPLTGSSVPPGVPEGVPPGRGPSWRRRVATLASLERGDLGTVAIYAVFIGLTALAMPLSVQVVVNAVAFATLAQPLVLLTLLVLVGMGGSALLRALQARVVERLQERVFVRAATEFAFRLPRIRFDALSGIHAPEKVNRFFDVLTAQKALAALLLDGLFLALQAVVGMLLLAFYHPYLLAFDVVLLAAVMLVIFGLGRGAVVTSLAESSAKYAVVAWLEDVARSPLAFRLHPDAALERTDALARGYLYARRKHFRIVFRQIVGSLTVQVLASASLLAVGGVLLLKGQLTLGQLVAAELVVTSVVAGVAKLAKHLEAYYDLATALEKVGSVTDLALERGDGARVLPGRGPVSLVVDALSYRFPGRTVLSSLSFAVDAGERVAILGPHGAGKSTLAELLLGLREPREGTVTISEVDVRELRLSELRRDVALVRDVEVIEASVSDNVGLWRREVSPEDVQRALELVGLGRVVARLPDGVATKLLPGGGVLSLGEAQRLVVARALAGRPRLLVIDGLLDGVEAQGLKDLERGLAGHGAETTVIVLTSLPHVAAWAGRTIALPDPAGGGR